MQKIFFNKRLATITIGLVILFVLFKKINLSLAFNNFMHADFRFLVIGFLLTFFYPLFIAFRWKYALKAVKLEIPHSRCLDSVMLSFAVNVLTPAKSGDLIKGFAIRDLSSVKQTTSVVIAERLGDLMVLGLLGCVGSCITHDKTIIVISALFLLLCLLCILVSDCIGNLIRIGKTGRLLAIICDGAAIWKNATFAMLKSAFWSLANWLTACLQVWLFFIALGSTINLVTVICLFPVAIFISLLPITFAGLGVRETSMGYLFSPFALLSTSVTVSLGYFICNYGITALVGTIYLMFFSTSLYKKT